MDGISSDEELKTLEELGITYISLRTNDPNTNTDETEFIMTSSVTFKNGDIRDISEISRRIGLKLKHMIQKSEMMKVRNSLLILWKRLVM